MKTHGTEMTAENVIPFKHLILARLQGKAGPPLDVRSDERYPDGLVQFYEDKLSPKQRSDFTQAVLELLQDEQVEVVSFNGAITLNLVALCRRLQIQRAEPVLLSLASALNSQKEKRSADGWDLMSEILSALGAIGTNRSENLLCHLVTSSPEKRYQIGAFTALARLHPDEALKYLPQFEEAKTDADKADFLAMVQGLIYGIEEESLLQFIDKILRPFKNAGNPGKTVTETLHRIPKAKRHLDNIHYVLIFRLRCWHGLKPRDIATLLDIQETEVHKKWHILKHQFLIPLLIEKGILDQKHPGLKKNREKNQ